MQTETENMSTAILDAICETYKDDKDLITSCLCFLYYRTNDERLLENIIHIMSDMNYCIECGKKMLHYEWEDTHDELDGYNKELYTTNFCPNCDHYEIKNLNVNKKGE